MKCNPIMQSVLDAIERGVTQQQVWDAMQFVKLDASCYEIAEIIDGLNAMPHDLIIEDCVVVMGQLESV